MAEILLALRNIKVDYGDRSALQLPSLDVHTGEVLALIGPNGAGKSTLLRVMGLLQAPTSGKLFFRNEEFSRRNALDFRRRMASVFQEPLLLNASVYDNVVLGLRLRGLSSREMETRARPWLERLAINHLAARRVRTVSGGEAQRTSLVRALVLDPELLLLDEPFAGLDEPTRDTLIDDVQRVLKMSGITTLLVTHDRNEAFRLADRVGILVDGRLLQLGSSVEVFRQPHSEQAAEIVGFENRIPGVVRSIAEGVAVIRFNAGTVAALGELHPGTRVIMCIRAEDVRLNRCDDGLGSSGGLNCIKGIITSVSAGMPQYRIIVKNGNLTLKAAISQNKLRELDIVEGSEVVATFQSDNVHVVRDREDYRTVG